MNVFRKWVSGLVLLAVFCFPGQGISLEAPSLSDEAVTTLSRYLAIDTTNPPGNEMAAARFLKAILDREGIENQLFDLGKNRANIYAVLRGNGRKRPVILLHHMDVVPADTNYWKVPPFSGAIRNGEIYGRGAVDIKGKGIIDLMAMIHLKRKKTKLSRDIIFLGVADEEQNSLGTQWMIKQKPDLVQPAEFLIDEGECITRSDNGRVLDYAVSIAEKTPLWLKLVFRGESGHGSVPLADSAVNRLVRVANRLLRWEQPFQISPEIFGTIEKYLQDRDLKQIPGFQGDLGRSLKNSGFLREIARDPEVNAAMRNTLSLTMLSGSDKINTIPNEATLGLDCRLMPGTSPDLFLKELKAVADDGTMEIRIEERLDIATTTFSPIESEFLTALKTCAGKWDPGIRVRPVILVSSTDSAYFRAIGIKTYGFESYRLTPEEYGRSHGNDERLSVDNVKFGVLFLTDLLTELCGPGKLRGKKRARKR